MSDHAVPEPLGEPIDRLLETPILERSHPSAALAHRVMVMLPTRYHWLEAVTALSDINPLHQAHAVKQVQRSVHARDAHAASLGPQPIGDLLSGQAAVLPRQQSNDRLPGPPEPVAGARQRPACKGLPITRGHVALHRVPSL